MLRSRIITGLVLALTVLVSIYFFSPALFSVFFWFVGLVAAYEYAGLAGIERRWLRWAYAALFTVLVLLTYFEPALRLPGLFISAAIWAMALLVVFTYPRSGALLQPWVRGVVGVFISWAAWIALVVVREAPGGSNWLLWMMLLVAFADIGAYFSGRRFGRRKLAAEVSPGKTWEGFWGGMLSSSVLCGSILVLMDRFNGGWIFIMVLLVTVSVVGDLFESVLKRERGVKDSGVILPGHGGVLDRIDSAVAVLPYFALILIYAGLSD